MPFAIARDRVVSLTSFGNVDVKAVLRDGDGRVVGRFDDRVDDWNIAVSRYLAAGRYVLDLSKVAPPPTQARSLQDDSGDQEDPDTDKATADSPDQPQQEGEAPEAAAEKPEERVELRLMLPHEAEQVEAAASGTVTLRGTEVHRLGLPPVPAGDG